MNKMKQVRETAAGRAIGAYVIFREDGTKVATVHTWTSRSGNVLRVDVFQTDTAMERCAFQVYGTPSDYALQQGYARGSGVDKLATALAGMFIDGRRLVDWNERIEGFRILELFKYHIIQVI